MEFYMKTCERENKDSGLCYVQLIISILLGGIILSSFSFNLANTFLQMNHILHGVEILQMDRFARQKIYKRLKYANEDVKVRNKVIFGKYKRRWGIKIDNSKVGIILSDGQVQSLSGQVFRGEPFGYRVKMIGGKSIDKDLNNCIKFKWSMRKNNNRYRHIVNTAVYPYYYKIEKYNKYNKSTD